MGFLERIINTLIKPRKMVESISKEPLIEEAVMVVGIYSLFSGASAYIRYTKLAIIIKGAPLMNPEFTSAIVIISAIFFGFITWFVLTGIVHTISIALGGEGKFYPHMMVLVGFAMIPLIFSSIISAILFSTAETNTVEFIIGSSASEQLLREVQSSTPYLASTIVSSIAWIWSFGVVYLGLQSYQKLSRGKALVAVGIPLIVLMLMTTYGMW